MRPLRVVLVALNASGYRSLGLAYIRAYAQMDGRLRGRVAFQTLDLEAGVDPWQTAFRVHELQPDVVGISVTCWSALDAYDLARVVKRGSPSSLVVVGGPEVTPIAEDTLRSRDGVDVVVRGEGEVAFADLLHAILVDGPLERVEGISFKAADGSIVSTPDRALVADLDSLPSPYLTGVLQPVDGATYVETYRGCPHECAYCFEGKGSRRVRSFSKSRVEAEIALVAGTSGVRSFSFIDPVFNLTRERLEWLAGVMRPYATEGVRLHTIEVDIERVDDATAALLASAGVASVETGPQTTGQLALEACRRKFDKDRFLAGVEACKRHGIQVECDLIIGLPGDSVDDFMESMRFCVSLDPGKIQASTLRVLPGTELWNRAQELGIAFDPEPPHEVVRTAEASYADLRRAEVLAVWLQRQYDARV